MTMAGPRRVSNGTATNDLVFSACADGNDRVFPRILALYVTPGSVVADVTYGKGVFWRRVPSDRYSYFLVFWKAPANGRPIWQPPQ